MQSLKRIYALLTEAERVRARFLLVLMVIGTGLEMIGVGLVVPAVAVLVKPAFVAKYPVVARVFGVFGASQNAIVVGGILILASAYVVKTFYLAVLARLEMAFAFDVQIDLSQRLLTTYLRQPYTFHLQRNSAQLIQNVVNETNVFTFSAMQPAMVLLTEGCVVTGLVALLFVVEPRATLLIVGLLGGAGAVFNRLLRKRIDAAATKRQRFEAVKLQHIQEALGGAKEIRLLGREQNSIEQYRFSNTEAARAGELQQTLQQYPRLLLELMGVLALAVVVLSAVYSGRDLSAVVPALALFAAAGFRLMPSGNRVMGSLQWLRYASPLLTTVQTELALPIPAPASGSPIDTISGEIRLANVTYMYPAAATPALRDVSLVIAKGQIVGFVGPSGAGKSTLVDVILGLLPVADGSVSVDGQDIRSHIRSWQTQIGYVPQAIYLADDTLRRNIALGLPDDQIDDRAVWRALAAAQLKDFVETLPDGLNATVGERGVRLSGGQRQRIGIARALYTDPAVLVLDEATSALDVATEAGVMDAVRALRGAKTILIVAHRYSTVEYCDVIHCVDAGEIAEAERLAAAAPHTLA